MAGIGGIGAVKLTALALAGAAAAGGAWWFAAPEVRQPVMAVPPVETPPVVASPAPEVVPEPVPQPDPLAPGFDVVRVDRDGAALVAGRGVAGTTLALRLDGVRVAEVPVGADGQFVAFFDVPAVADPQLLELAWTAADGTERVGAEGVVLAPRAAVSPEATDGPDTDAAQVPQAAFRTRPEEVAPMAARAPLDEAGLAIDSILYEADGAVVVQGRSGSAGTLRLSLDGAEMGETALAAPGPWRITLPEVAPGRYTLGAAVGDGARAVAADETPFMRADPDSLAGAEAVSGARVVTVQPGWSLWRIARERYGSGAQYVQLIEANRAEVADPDVIYPGQVLRVPE